MKNWRIMPAPVALSLSIEKSTAQWIQFVINLFTAILKRWMKFIKRMEQSASEQLICLFGVRTEITLI